MKLLKAKIGYEFITPLASVGKNTYYGKYFIKLRLFGFKYWSPIIYWSDKKPRFRYLGLISLITLPAIPLSLMMLLLGLICVIISYFLMVTGQFIKALSRLCVMDLDAFIVEIQDIKYL